METSRKPADMSVAGFLAWQNRQIESFEYLSGDIIDVAPQSPLHSTIVSNIRTGLSNRLRGTPWRAYHHGVRLVAGGSAALLPDIVMTRSLDHDLVTEPFVVFEVVSPDTERRDRILKNRVYRTIPSLMQYVMVMQDRVQVETMRRTEAGWSHDMIADPSGVLSLPAHGLDLCLGEIYATTETLSFARSAN